MEEKLQSELSAEYMEVFKGIDSDPNVLYSRGLVLDVDTITQYPGSVPILVKDADENAVFASTSKLTASLFISLLHTISLNDEQLALYENDQDILLLPVAEKLHYMLSTSDNKLFKELVDGQQRLLGEGEFMGQVVNGATYNTFEFHRLLSVWGQATNVTFNGADIFETETVERNLYKAGPTHIWNGGRWDHLTCVALLPFFSDEAVELLGIKGTKYEQVYRKYLKVIKASLFNANPYEPSSVLSRLGIDGFEKNGWVEEVALGGTQMAAIPNWDVNKPHSLTSSLCFVPKKSGGCLVFSHNVAFGVLRDSQEAVERISWATDTLSEFYREVLARVV